MEHSFTQNILNILTSQFNQQFANAIFSQSALLQYINLKTKSANKGSKSRGSFANLYAIFVLLEDYVKQQYHLKEGYAKYEGVQFNKLLSRQRELPFGEKLQNHALNHRLNEEFKKFFPLISQIPILRDNETNRYWFNEGLLKIKIENTVYNLAPSVLLIIEQYTQVKRESFERFLEDCNNIASLFEGNGDSINAFISDLLSPKVDARIFEIVSFAILKYYYTMQAIYFGYTLETIEKESLKLYKTGRTNSNDGGIDFVMKPLGRFFQVTETLDFKKYFLDIDKVEKYPLTFVVKSNESVEILKQKIEQGAIQTYTIDTIVQKYLSCIEEIINIPKLLSVFEMVVEAGYLSLILDEIIQQSKVEFNYND